MTNKEWVDKYLVPLEVCNSAINKANEYDDPQSAWDDWDNPTELLWTIERTYCNKRLYRLCACEMAEHVLHIFEEKYPDDKRPRRAIETSRRFANGVADKGELGAAYSSACDAAYAASSYPAYAARAAAYAAGDDAANAAANAAAAVAAATDSSAEKKCQADCVRKFFPISPFVKRNKNE